MRSVRNHKSNPAYCLWFPGRKQQHEKTFPWIFNAVTSLTFLPRPSPFSNENKQDPQSADGTARSIKKFNSFLFPLVPHILRWMWNMAEENVTNEMESREYVNIHSAASLRPIRLIVCAFCRTERRTCTHRRKAYCFIYEINGNHP